MIKIVTNDEQITVKEIDEILSKVESQDENLFYTNVRTSKKEKEAIKHSTFITAREEIECPKCFGTGYPHVETLEFCPKCKGTGNISKLIGLVRIIGDSTYEYYLTEVMVDPAYQGKGIGTRLMEAALEYCKRNGFMKIFLTAAKGREEYYRRFGFKITDYNIMRILNEKI